MEPSRLFDRDVFVIPFRTSTYKEPSCFTITVDTEEEWDWEKGFSTQSPCVKNVHGIPRFQEVCERFGAKVTYFVNYSILASKECEPILRALSANPMVEIGLHYHPWNTPPLSLGSNVPVQETYLSNLDWPTAKSKLDSIFSQFDRLGIKPKSFRGGRYSTSPMIQEYLSSRGIQADCSVFPYCRWEESGAPDYSSRGFEMVRIPFINQNRYLWEIPLTRGFTRGNWSFLSKVFLLLESKPWRYFRIIGLLEKFGITRRVWLNFEESLGKENFFLRSSLNRLRLPAINFTLHSSSLLVGGNSYIRDSKALETMYKSLEATLTWLRDDGVYESATVGELVEKFERYYHARARD
jgi:hypothetical protein